MKPGYIISAYKRPDLLKRLVESLGANQIAIHIDKKYNIADFTATGLGDLPNVTFLPQHTCYWGLFGHVLASLEGMKWFLSTSCDYAILLTGQCFPLKSNEEIEFLLSELKGRSIIEFEKFPKSGWEHSDGGYKRLDRFYFSVHHPLYKKFKLFDFLSVEVARSEVLRQVRSIKMQRRTVPFGLHPYGGSGYWCLSRSSVSYVVDYLKAHPGLQRFFATTFVPDEMFFQTILANSPFKDELINSPIHYMDWSLNQPHPAVLNVTQLQAAFSSGAWFARKFEDSDVLDHIELMRKDKVCV